MPYDLFYRIGGFLFSLNFYFAEESYLKTDPLTFELYHYFLTVHVCLCSQFLSTFFQGKCIVYVPYIG